MSAAKLNVELRADAGGLLKGLKTAEESIGKFGARARKQVEDVQKSLGDRIGEIGAKAQKSGDNILYALSAPLGALAGLSIKAAGDFETLRIAMVTTMTDSGRSTADALKEVESLRQAALAPGLDFEQAVRASIRLQNVGYSAEKARKIVQELANAITMSGGNADNLESVTQQFTQMIAKGRVMQDDLRVIADAMPKVAELSKKAFGVFNAEQLRDKGISAAQFVEGITNEMTKLKRVEGGISNALVNAKTAIKQTLGVIGDEINKAFDIAKRSDEFSAWMGRIGKSISDMGPVTKQWVLGFGAVVVAIGPIIKIVGLVISSFSSLISIGSAVVGGLKAVVTATISAINALSALKVTAGSLSFLTAGVLLLVPAALALASAFGDMEKGAAQTNRINEKLAQTQSAINEEYSKEKAVVTSLFDTANNYRLSTDERREALRKLKEQYPEYVGNLDLEKVKLTELGDVQQMVIDRMKEGIKQRMKQATIVSELEKQAKAEMRLNQIRQDGFSALSGQEVSDAGLSLFGTDFEKKFVSEEGKKLALKNIEKFYGDVIDETRNTINAVNKQFDDLNPADNFYAFRDAEENFKKVPKAPPAAPTGGKKEMSESLKHLKEQQKLYAEILDSIKAAQEAGSVLGDGYDRQADAIGSGIEKLLEKGFAAGSKEVQHMLQLSQQLRDSLGSTHLPASITGAADKELADLHNKAKDLQTALETAKAGGLVDAASLDPVLKKAEDLKTALAAAKLKGIDTGEEKQLQALVDGATALGETLRKVKVPADFAGNTKALDALLAKAGTLPEALSPAGKEMAALIAGAAGLKDALSAVKTGGFGDTGALDNLKKQADALREALAAAKLKGISTGEEKALQTLVNNATALGDTLRKAKVPADFAGNTKVLDALVLRAQGLSEAIAPAGKEISALIVGATGLKDALAAVKTGGFGDTKALDNLKKQADALRDALAAAKLKGISTGEDKELLALVSSADQLGESLRKAKVPADFAGNTKALDELLAKAGTLSDALSPGGKEMTALIVGATGLKDALAAVKTGGFGDTAALDNLKKEADALREALANAKLKGISTGEDKELLALVSSADALGESLRKAKVPADFAGNTKALDALLAKAGTLSDALSPAGKEMASLIVGATGLKDALAAVKTGGFGDTTALDNLKKQADALRDALANAKLKGISTGEEKELLALVSSADALGESLRKAKVPADFTGNTKALDALLAKAGTLSDALSPAGKEMTALIVGATGLKDALAAVKTGGFGDTGALDNLKKQADALRDALANAKLKGISTGEEKELLALVDSAAALRDTLAATKMPADFSNKNKALDALLLQAQGLSDALMPAGKEMAALIHGAERLKTALATAKLGGFGDTAALDNVTKEAEALRDAMAAAKLKGIAAGEDKALQALVDNALALRDNLSGSQLPPDFAGDPQALDDLLKKAVELKIALEQAGPKANIDALRTQALALRDAFENMEVPALPGAAEELQHMRDMAASMIRSLSSANMGNIDENAHRVEAAAHEAEALRLSLATAKIDGAIFDDLNAQIDAAKEKIQGLKTSIGAGLPALPSNTGLTPVKSETASADVPAPNASALVPSGDLIDETTNRLRRYKEMVEQVGQANKDWQAGNVGIMDTLRKVLELLIESGNGWEQIAASMASGMVQAADSGGASWEALQKVVLTATEEGKKGMELFSVASKAAMQSMANSAVASAAKVVRAWITQGVAAAVAKALQFLPPPFNLIAAAAAGAGAAGIFNAALSALRIPAMADGGVAFGPSTVLVGEYSGARGNPEVIAPLDKLKGMLGGGAQSSSERLVARVSGRELLIMLEREEKTAKRSRG